MSAILHNREHVWQDVSGISQSLNSAARTSASKTLDATSAKQVAHRLTYCLHKAVLAGMEWRGNSFKQSAINRLWKPSEPIEETEQRTEDQNTLMKRKINLSAAKNGFPLECLSQRLLSNWTNTDWRSRETSQLHCLQCSLNTSIHTSNIGIAIHAFLNFKFRFVFEFIRQSS